MRKTVHVVTCCHNRVEITLRGISRIFSSEIDESRYELKLTVVDDGSSDGTSEKIKTQFPFVNLVPGDGSLFWAGGMRRAMRETHAEEIIVFFNDDVDLYKNSLSSGLKLLEKINFKGLVGGIVVDPSSRKTSYGGLKKRVNGFLEFDMLKLNNKEQEVDCLNGNFMLFTRETYDRVGGLDPNFVHCHADLEFCLRAKSEGFRCFLLSEVVGECTLNNLDQRIRNQDGFFQKFSYLLSHKGLYPTEWFRLCRIHADKPIRAFLRPYIRYLQGVEIGFVNRG